MELVTLREEHCWQGHDLAVFVFGGVVLLLALVVPSISRPTDNTSNISKSTTSSRRAAIRFAL